jgi:single-stranded DNA-binding protein
MRRWFHQSTQPVVVRAFKTLAENVVESLAKGERVFVKGIVTTDSWTVLT